MYMEHKRPMLVATEDSKHPPLLIIDKKGTLGVPFAKHLQEQFLLVLVSAEDVSIHKNVIHIPYRKKIPVIPDNRYSHLFVFYNGEQEILDMLPSLMHKANALQSKLFFITSLAYSSPELLQRLNHHVYQQMQVIIYGEIFDKNLSERNITTLFIHQAKIYNRVEIPNEGIGKLYPIHLDDVFKAIVATAFGAEKKKHVVLIFPKHATTELSVARILQKNNPLLRVDFVKYKGRPPYYHIPKEGEYVYADYPFETRLREVVSGYEFRQPIKKTKKKRKYSFPKQKVLMSPSTFLIMFVCLLISPILLTIITAVSGAGAMQLSVRQIEKGDIAFASRIASFAHGSISLSEKIGSSLFYLDPFMKPQKDAIVQQISVGKKLAATEDEMLKAILLLQAVVEKKSKNPKGDFMQAIAVLKNSLITLQKMRAEKELPSSLENKFVNLEPILLPLQNTVDALPSILGFEGKRTYLILFQNNMELRPGGGFIGSYGLLTLENGVVAKFTVHDVYDADGRLTVHIEPPFGLRRYLGASHWFLRDSNFAIDFPRNAGQATTFLELETGDKVDGVLAIDTSFLKNVLSAMGSVEVPDYKEIVTADNFYLRTQTHAEKDFFPGSTQKRDFLRALLAAMQTKLTQQKDINYNVLFGKVGESVLGKHVLFVFSDAASQKLFTVNNLSSSLWDGREQGKNEYLDFFGVIDANVGLNKTNYYLKRAIDQKTTLDEAGTIITTASVVYTNTSKKNSPFGGDYKNYVRFVLPPHVVLREVKIDDVKKETTGAITDPAIFTAENFIQPKELEIETSQEQGKDIIGLLLFVPTGSTKKVSITYEAVGAISPRASIAAYNLWLFKQPGTQDDTYAFSLGYPAVYKPILIDKNLSEVGGKLIYSGTLTEDKELKVEFSKK